MGVSVHQLSFSTHTSGQGWRPRPRRTEFRALGALLTFAWQVSAAHGRNRAPPQARSRFSASEHKHLKSSRCLLPGDAGVDGNLHGETAVQHFLATFRTAMALAGEVKVFVASFPFTPIGPGELKLAAGDQVVVGDQGSETESLEWLYGEHQDGEKGWFPRHCGAFFVFADADVAHLGSHMKICPRADAGLFGCSHAVGELSGDPRRRFVDACLASLAASEGKYVAALRALVDGFVVPLELRDRKYKAQLLENAKVGILCGQLRDLAEYHDIFLGRLKKLLEGGSEEERLAASTSAMDNLAMRYIRLLSLLVLSLGKRGIIHYPNRGLASSPRFQVPFVPGVFEQFPRGAALPGLQGQPQAPRAAPGGTSHGSDGGWEPLRGPC